ncbi:hypothetical protein BHE90_005025 [Fusarium euwallaceae]|uniref:Uncharacterized protein n=5 Tax=Fusarium solani species complex TaxID=232080 RepID=A0A3M2SMZ3_9HYPO|nr:hypothetical protein CDV36_001376 [Fusarium kuroshium]RSL75750.1 hypothetical protein CEP51_010589 [Fusarium floridanum]RSM13204.1 hypothetical protein CEP52_002062 [Fusarium oligoseptatum]RSM17741.1 hypothetical protein CDV31_003348 [Fusarium ambrosium]RTE80443.1 hypothetical protein BHE90_005025 [Fusarium euwallaceae]
MRSKKLTPVTVYVARPSPSSRFRLESRRRNTPAPRSITLADRPPAASIQKRLDTSLPSRVGFLEKSFAFAPL